MFNNGIFFLLFIPINILIKNNNTHMAHGLNPSAKPIKIDIIGIVKFFNSIVLPKIDILCVVYSLI